MCSVFGPSSPKPPPPPAAPPPAPEPSAKVTDEIGAEDDTEMVKRKGRNSLRIDLHGGHATSGGTGLNIPQA